MRRVIRVARPVALVLTFAVMLALMAGCWDRRELDEQMHVLSAYLDLEPDGMLRLTVEVLGLLPGGGQGQTGGPGTHSVLSARGASWQDAAWNLRWQSAEMSFAHMGAVVIGEELARAGIVDVLDALAQSYEIRRRLYVAVMAGRAADLLSASLTANRHSEQIIELLRGAGLTGTNGGDSTLNEALRALGSEGKDLILARFVLMPPPPVAHVAEHAQGRPGGGMAAGDEQGAGAQGGVAGGGEQEAPPVMALNGAAILKDGVLVGFLEEREAGGVQFVLRAGTNMRIRIPTGTVRQGFTLRTAMVSPRVSVQHKDGRLAFDLHLSFSAKLEELETGGGEMSSPADIAHLAQLAAQHLQDQVFDGLHYCINELEADPAGLGRLVSRRRPDLWDRYRAGWPQALGQAEIKVNVTVNIPSTGMLVGKVRGPAMAPREGGM